MSITFEACELINHADGYKLYEPVPGNHGANLSNRNAFIVLAALGVDDLDMSCGGMPIDEFMGKAQSWLQAHIGKPSTKVETKVDVGDKRCTMVDFGIDEGYVNRRIREMVMLAQDGKAKGATHFTWG